MMQNFDEGYIKYINNWEQYFLLNEFDFIKLITCRNNLKSLNLIGVYPNGIGFGNVSCRVNITNQFIISGTQTADVNIADTGHFSLVYRVDIDQNTLFCKGPVKASSEALTHAAIYLADPKINCVIHVHHPEKWQSLLNKVTTIDKNIAYGTPQLAKNIAELLKNDQTLKREKIFVTAGHEDGIFVFGI
mgnify:CR=1 FL=1